MTQDTKRRRHVLFAASEAFPFFKSGGLGDVAGTLPKYLNGDEFEVRVILPMFQSIPKKYMDKMVFRKYFYVPLAWRNQYCGLFELKCDNIVFYFLDNEYYFYRNEAYGYFDDGERMAFLSKAILESIIHMEWDVDILHCNDWHTALSTVFLREHYNQLEQFRKIRTVFTIHNLKFQGQYDPFVFGDILGLGGTPAESQLFVYEYGRRSAVNYMLGALCYSDRITTVSPTYAEEIKTPYFGENMDWMFRKRSSVLHGILNGIDTKSFSPETDVCITSNYGAKTVTKKYENKLVLQNELGLKSSKKIPLFAIISRFTEQKGLDLVISKLQEMEKREMQLVALGVGDKKYEEAFSYYAHRNPEKFAVCMRFDEALSHRIYAGADALLMPSRFEPCGLSQMIAMRYGTLPVVRETGGLKDSVQAYNKYNGAGTGFSFANYNADEFMTTIDNALHVYYDLPADWSKMQRCAMLEDFSWQKSAEEYKKLYRELL